MDDTAHIDPNGRVQAKLLGDSRHFVCSQHNSQAQEHIGLERHHAKKQQGRLHERSQADGNGLLAPLVEAVRVPSGYGEHIQTSNRDLHQQDTASLDVGKKDLDDAVGKSQQDEDGLQANHSPFRCHKGN